MLSAFSQWLLDASANWPMDFGSVHYLFFLPLVVGAYFCLQGTARKVWLLAASYWFYLFAAPKYGVVLLFGTLLSYSLGRWVSSRKSDQGRKISLFLSVSAMILLLCFFKYNDFFAQWLAPALARLGVDYNKDFFIVPLGLSFYTFTAIGYLVDVSAGEVPVEKNLLHYALFLGFFASISQGPISRAGKLLPQLKDVSRKFNLTAAPDALRLLAIGFFKKLAIADTLAVFVTQVYGDVYQYQGLTLTLAAVVFAFQLYFDFSGYTDIARGSAQLLGIELPENFQNPYFSTNYSSFWSRWHMSLSSFLQDYVFMPVVWSRWTEKLPVVGKKVTRPPVLSAVAVTFLLSGIWHGDTLCFVVWGALQALFRIGEEILHRTLGKPPKKISPWRRAGKILVVLVLWIESLVFFKVGLLKNGSVQMAVDALTRQFLPQQPGALLTNLHTAAKDGFYGDGRIAALFLFFSLFCLILGLWADWVQHFRLGGKSLATALGGLSAGRRWALYMVLCLCCFAGFIGVNGGFGGGSFLYGGF